MGKLWQKEYTLDVLMEEFTVGTDYITDRHLVVADCIGSIAHARCLAKAGFLSSQELIALEKGLRKIIKLAQSGDFVISKADEDCHTAIESYLVADVGEAGKKIHTGRSRNDQVQTALRLWMREFIIVMAIESASLAKALFEFAEKHEFVPMPGRTHLQLAMPSSVGLWAASFAEELLDEARLLKGLWWLLDQSPLGSAASYGTPLPLDRSYAAHLMGYSRVQNNVLYANNSRGKFEAVVLDGCDYITLTLSKLAEDLILFSLPEFGYFSLPKELCTGSSIMPQKRNPDGLELMRSKSAVVSSCSARVKMIIHSLPSGYNRDFQDTKEPLFTGTKTALMAVRIMQRIVERLIVHPQRLEAACTKELYATDEVFNRLSAGGSFRDLYREVGMDLDSIGSYDPKNAILKRTSQGTTGALGLQEHATETQSLIEQCETDLASLYAVYKEIAGVDLSLIS